MLFDAVSRRSRVIALASAVVLLAGSLSFAGLRKLYTESLIKPLLPGPGAFACFSARFDHASVDIADWAKGRQIPSDQRLADGSARLVTVFDKEPDVPLTTLVLRLDYDARKSDYDWIYNFSLLADTGKGRLTARGECPWYDKDYIETTIGRLPAGTFTLTCGIDCDGGLFEVTRVTATQTITVDFGRRIGLTMKMGCGGEGGRLRVYANAREETLTLAPARPEACAKEKMGL